MKQIVFILIGMLIGNMLATYNQSHITAIPMIPYSINIVDEHEVVLSHSNDTIRLYLENATVLSDEYVILITK
jgi:hypothetical protein